MRKGPLAAIFVIIIVAMVYIGYIIYNKIEEKKLYNTVTEQFINKQAPQIEGVTIDGQTWKLSDQLGKKVVIIFWHSRDTASKKQMKYITEFYKMHKDDDSLAFMSICLDTQKTLDDLKVFMKEYEVDFPIIFDPKSGGYAGELAQSYGFYRAPSMWIIDEQGKVKEHNLRAVVVVETQLRELEK